MIPGGVRCESEIVKSTVFTRSVFDPKPRETYFIMTLTLIRESFVELSLLTFCVLVAPVSSKVDLRVIFLV